MTMLSAVTQFLRQSLAGSPLDRTVTNNLLATLRDTVGPTDPARSAAIEEALIVGDYPHVARLLPTAQVLPKKRAADYAELSRCLAEVKAGEAIDPLRVQSSLSRLVDGLDNETIPQWLRDRQRWLSKRASALARHRAKERAGAATRPVQRTNECWLRCLYHVAALEPVRAAMTYEVFVERVGRQFPERDILGQGLSFGDFETLTDKMGMVAPPLITNEDDLARMIGATGGVIGAIGFFEIDTSRMNAIQALPHWRQHAVLITAVSGRRGQRLFTVDDPGLPYETRYTQAEFDVLQLIVYRIQTGSATSAAVKSFLGAQ